MSLLFLWLCDCDSFPFGKRNVARRLELKPFCYNLNGKRNGSRSNQNDSAKYNSWTSIFGAKYGFACHECFKRNADVNAIGSLPGNKNFEIQNPLN